MSDLMSCPSCGSLCFRRVGRWGWYCSSCGESLTAVTKFDIELAGKIRYFRQGLMDQQAGLAEAKAGCGCTGNYLCGHHRDLALGLQDLINRAEKLIDQIKAESQACLMPRG